MKKRVRIGLVLVSLIFLIVLISGVVMAACSESQTIMKLFSPSNSHGALWNDADYTYDICYDKIFRVQGNGNHNGNNIIWLSSSSNSHASIIETKDYNTPVKYGDLTCTKRENTCNDDERMAVALFSDSNSHITDPNYMPDGIVSWYRFDDGTADDWLGRNNGVLKNGASSVKSKIGRGLNLDGVNDYVEIADDNSLDLTTFTTEAWFKLDRLPNDGELFEIVGKGEGPNTTKYNYHLNIMKNISLWNPARNSATIHCAFEDSSDADYNLLFDIDSSYVGRYVHVACTLSGNSFKLYIDGVDKTSDSYLYNRSADEITNPPAGGLPVPTFTASPLVIGASICGIGGRCTAGTIGNFFPGIIDEVAIYNRSLTAEEIQHRYNMGMYEKKICCKTGTAPPVSGNTYWSNMKDEKINSSDLNDEVKMNIENLGISSGVEINYSVYKEDGSGFLFIRWDKKIAQISGKDSAVWIANQTGVFYFKVKIIGAEYSSENEPYGRLTVNNVENNKFPVVIMNKPDAESKHLVNSAISFEQSSYDEDDVLKAIWDFGDGNITTLLNCNNYGNCNTTHKYSLNGVKTIRLTAKEMRSTRAQENSTSRRIFLYSQGINVFAVISKPDINKIDIPVLGSVEFNASLSYVANCTLNTCPSVLALPQGVSGCYDVNGTVDGVFVNLKCFDYPKTGANGIGNSSGKYNLWFNWTFDEIPYNKIGNWAENYAQVVEFSRNYAHARVHPVSLIAGYKPF